MISIYRIEIFIANLKSYQIDYQFFRHTAKQPHGCQDKSRFISFSQLISTKSSGFPLITFGRETKFWSLFLVFTGMILNFLLPYQGLSGDRFPDQMSKVSFVAFKF
jgi:hypothetical protein